MSEKNAVLEARITKSPPFSLEVQGAPKVNGETLPRRNPKTIKELAKNPINADIKTIWDVVTTSSARFGNAKAVSSRKLIKTHNETKKVKKIVDGQETMVDKKWSFFELGEYKHRTFIEYEQLVLQVASGLRKLGLQKDDKLHIFAATSANWLCMSHAAASQTMPIVTAYDTLGEEGLKSSLVATEAKAIFLDPHLLTNLIKPLNEAKDIKFVIYNDEVEVKREDIDKLKSAHDSLTILSFGDLRELGEKNMVDPVPPTPEDLCCIMYTSGSTGTPKGVPLRHRNIVSAVAGISTIIEPVVGPGDRLLAYLPLAHILEYFVENSMLYWGAHLGYGNPKTLSDVSVKNCAGDIREFRPTLLMGVPAVWESIKKGISTKVNSGSPIVKNLFWGALWAKSGAMTYGLPGSWLLDALVFKKVREATGGAIRICLNGGGPVSQDTQRFISLAIAPMINGYGLTETVAMGALTDPFHWTDKATGDVPGCVEVKLVDFADAGYFATNKPNPQGEVWIRGGSVMEGYWKNEKETAEALTKDGWFKTGDIGEWDSNGHLKIIDRKKNLVKTLNGEYIALEKLESVYRSTTVVANICVYASPNEAKPVAIVVPAEPALKKLASSIGVEGSGLDDLVHNMKLQDAVLREMIETGKAGGLAGIELIQGVALADEEWTPANGLVTSAQKLNRKKILEKYKKDVDNAYK